MPARRTAVSWRSGLEDKVAADLTAKGVGFTYEGLKVPYVQPETSHRYTPDFQLPNGIILETKGLFSLEDRRKHLLVREQHPDLDIRFVFSRSATPIRKGSPTTYGDWCKKNGFLFADKLCPQEWLDEPPRS